MTVTLQYTELDPAWLLAKHLFLKEKDPISCDSSNLMPDGQTLPERVRLALFRIYQEALNNIIRHAGARYILIRFVTDPEQTTLEVQDDGWGFEAPDRLIDLARQGHLGLVGISERTKAIGGQLQIISTPGKGTIVRVTVPRHNE